MEEVGEAGVILGLDGRLSLVRGIFPSFLILGRRNINLPRIGGSEDRLVSDITSGFQIRNLFDSQLSVSCKLA